VPALRQRVDRPSPEAAPGRIPALNDPGSPPWIAAPERSPSAGPGDPADGATHPSCRAAGPGKGRPADATLPAGSPGKPPADRDAVTIDQFMREHDIKAAFNSPISNPAVWLPSFSRPKGKRYKLGRTIAQAEWAPSWTRRT